ncbi:MAG TPA: ATP-grasp domain-containing protein, partial [Methylocella sp.]|nr:ATP-grasp domain-containing protein [Methylocella sp.]
MKPAENGAAVLIAAASARALAAAARLAGYRPLAADFFGDTDTRELCARSFHIEKGLESGFTAETLIPALEALCCGEAPCGLVYGAGFEDRPGLLAALARRWPVFGNAAQTVQRVKDPLQLLSLCAKLEIPHPEISLKRPRDCEGWLAKAAGGSGGTHVLPAASEHEAGENIYYQRMAKGVPASILFLADGQSAQTVGFSRQWAAPAPGEPFRFGGSLRPAELSAQTEEALRQAAEAVAAACGLRGLNSIDFLVDGKDWTLIEINPRPGATLDIFHDPSGSLFHAHLEACRGRLPRQPFQFPGAAAAAIVFARQDISSMPGMAWPAWAADRQKPQSRLRPHDPLCTVKAWATEPRRARALAEARVKAILGKLDRIQ